MKKFFTTAVLASIFSAFSANAVNYMPQPYSTMPLDNSISTVGIVDIVFYWQQTDLEPNDDVTSTTTAIGYKITDLSYLTITVDGEPATVEGVSINLQNAQLESGPEYGSIKISLPTFPYFFSKGTVNLSIAEGMIKDPSNAINPNLELTYSVYDALPDPEDPYSGYFCPATFTPEESEASFELGEWGTITVNWADYVATSINESIYPAPIILISESLESGQMFLTDYSEIEDGKLLINIPHVSAGSYRLIVAEGALFFETEETTYINGETSYSFKITSNPDLTYNSATVTPENGAILQSLEGADKVVVTWGGSSISLENDKTPVSVIINNIEQTGFEVYLTQDGEQVSAGESGDALVVDLSSLNVAGGVYKVNIPGGFVAVSPSNGEGESLWSDEVATTYTVLVAPEALVNPETGTQYKTGDTMRDVTITWPGCYLNVNSGKTVTLSTPDGNDQSVTVTPSWKGMESVEGYVGNILTIDLSNLELQEGNYILNIPAGYVNLAGPFGSEVISNSDIELVYEVISEYMNAATQVTESVSLDDTYAAVELKWESAVSMVNADTFKLPVKMGDQEIGEITANNINLVPSGDSGISTGATRATNADKGDTMFILLGAAGLVDQLGQLSILIPEGVLINSVGSINKAQTIYVDVTTLAIGEITPTTGASFDQGTGVVLTITFEDDVEVNEDSEDISAPILVTDYDEYNETLTWTDDEVTIKDNTIILNLGADLEPGDYYVSLLEGVVLVDGVDNAAILDYQFTVKASQNDAINGITTVLTNEDAVYNLNGLKVNSNNLQKGIYIINGKKVVVK